MAGDRTDRKLEHVAVARFTYRHEAEFAAGFLEDARIPYRLQIDDPALGIPLSASATLWVTAMDEERARRVLEMEGGAVRDVDGLDDGAGDVREAREGGVNDRCREADEGDEGDEGDDDDEGDDGEGAGEAVRIGEAVRRGEVPSPVSPRSTPTGPRSRPKPTQAHSSRRPKKAPTESPHHLPGISAPKLSGRERLLAFGASVGVWSLSRLDVVANAPGGVRAVVVFGALGLLVIALSGRAPSTLRGILSTLSGDAP